MAGWLDASVPSSPSAARLLQAASLGVYTSNMVDLPERAPSKAVRRAWAVFIAAFSTCAIGCIGSPWNSVDPVIENATDATIQVRLRAGDQFEFESLIPPRGSLSVVTPDDEDLDGSDRVRVEASVAGSRAGKPVVATSSVGDDETRRAPHDERSPEYRPRYIVRYTEQGLVIERVQKIYQYNPSPPTVTQPQNSGGTP